MQYSLEPTILYQLLDAPNDQSLIYDLHIHMSPILSYHLIHLFMIFILPIIDGDFPLNGYFH